jgi:hypothetical protein
MTHSINDPKLLRICAEEAVNEDIAADFQALFEEIGEAADSTVKACMLAIQLFQEARRALQFHFSGARAIIQKASVQRAFDRYIEESGA